MKNQPIIEFKDEAQALECLKEWQTRLFLNDWIIKLELCDRSKDDDWGDVDINIATQKATVKLYQGTPNDCEIKKCMEKTLIHELLHMAFFTCGYGEDVTVEESVFMTWEHRRVEKMAQSLIMAKYNLPFEWFKNF